MEPEYLIGLLALLGLAGFALWAFFRKISHTPASPDPWSETVAAGIEGENATPLCHRCLTDHDSAADFCPNCGASVGQYTNWLPYSYLFSVGHMLRVGTSGEFNKTRFNVVGFVLLSFAEYFVFAPVYWLLLFLNLSRESDSGSKPQRLPNADLSG